MLNTERNFQAELPVEGSTQDLWKCISEAEEIVKWFAPKARVKGGAGGEIWMAWDDKFAGTSKIEVWEPEKHIRVVNDSRDGQGNPVKIAVDYYIETVNGQTRLRLVHSGYSSDERWDDEFHAISTGWKIFLQNLQYYLSNHRGEEVFNTWDTIPTKLSREEAWARITGANGLLKGKDGKLARDADFFLKSGEHALEGRIDLDWQPFIIGGVLKDLHGALFRLTNQSSGPIVELTFLGYGNFRQQYEDTRNQILKTLEAALNV